MMKMEGKFINVLCWLWSWWSEFVWLQFIDKHMRLLSRVLLINLFNNNVDLFLHLVCDAVCSKNTVTIMLCFCWLSVEAGASNYASASRREPRSQHRTLLVPASRRFSLERFRTRICIDLRTTHFPHPAVFLKPSPQLIPNLTHVCYCFCSSSCPEVFVEILSYIIIHTWTIDSLHTQYHALEVEYVSSK